MASERTLRRASFVFVPLVCLVFAELLAWAALHLVTREGFDRATLRVSLESSGPKDQPMNPSTFLLHPYLGFVGNPEVVSSIGGEVNPAGFFGPVPFRPKKDDEVWVGLAGGSLAALQVEFAGKQLREGLAALPRFAGKEVVLFNLAMGSWKQPQPALLVSYLMTLGVDLDMLLVIDGFNEVALPFPENVSRGVTGHFPRGWDFLAGGPTGALGWRTTLELLQLKADLAWWRGWLGTEPLRSSNLCLVLWDVIHRKKRKQINQIQAAPISKARDLPLALAGPPGFATTQEGAVAEGARVWEASSRFLADLCRAKGIEFRHFLQPNQYVEGSKPLSDEEARERVRVDHPYRPGVRLGYSKLRAAGERLRKAGVPFFDLTMVFAEDPATAYSDDCCHLTEHGAAVVGQAILESLRREGGTGTRADGP